ncbi:MAG: GNAT family N-acetyltransferase [Nocardioidaceae bacterium]|nr:GNAT family N-acetyltransferase [Nocardioidaceae bacterium]
MHIRDCEPFDLPALVDLTIEAFRPLFEEHWPVLMTPTIFAHVHGDWEADYRHEVPSLHDPAQARFITLAEDEGRVLGYVGWQVTDDGRSARLAMVAVHPDVQRRGVGAALCGAVLARLGELEVVVVHIGTGGDEFHAPARALYESLGFVGVPGVHYARALR